MERLCGVLFVAAALLCWRRTDSYIQPISVRATASYNSDFGPLRASDGNTLQTPHDSEPWLLPNGRTGAIRFDFDQPYRLSTISLLNTRNRVYFDRATAQYRVELAGPGASESVADVLPAYPQWQTHRFAASVAQSVVVHVDGFLGNGGGLCEVAFRGVPASPTRLVVDCLLALGAALGCWFVWPALQRRSARYLSIELSTLAVCITLLCLIGARLLYFSTAVSTFDWMSLYTVDEFKTLRSVTNFFADLRVPIPPWLAALEIAAYQLTGSNVLLTSTFYKLSVIGAYVFVVILAYPSIGRMILTTALSLLFVEATVLVHPSNPQLYDTAFGFLLLAFFATLVLALRCSSGRLRIAFIACAGIALSLWGLTRPFTLFLLPLPVAFALRRLFPLRRAEVCAFVLPLLLLCGAWHAQLWVRHGQFGMSNHGGYNLARAWPSLLATPLEAELTSAPFRGWNNPQHLANSAKLQHAFIHYVQTYPAEFVHMLIERILAVVNVRTDFPGRLDPTDSVLNYYRLVARMCMYSVFVSLVVRIALFSKRLFRRFRLRTLRPTLGELSLILTTACIAIMAIGEAGEECRFVISLLPLLTLQVVIDCFSLFQELGARLTPHALLARRL